MDTYIIRKSEDYEGDYILFITNDKQEAIEKADFYYANDKGNRGQFGNYRALRYAAAKEVNGYYFENLELVYEAGAK